MQKPCLAKNIRNEKVTKTVEQKRTEKRYRNIVWPKTYQNTLGLKRVQEITDTQTLFDQNDYVTQQTVQFSSNSYTIFCTFRHLTVTVK